MAICKKKAKKVKFITQFSEVSFTALDLMILLNYIHTAQIYTPPIYVDKQT